MPPAAGSGIRFGHVNVTSRDWRRLAAFYTVVFGCELVPPERDIRGPVLDAATGLTGAHLTGAHLRLPAHRPEFGDADRRPLLRLTVGRTRRDDNKATAAPHRQQSIGRLQACRCRDQHRRPGAVDGDVECPNEGPVVVGHVRRVASGWTRRASREQPPAA